MKVLRWCLVPLAGVALAACTATDQYWVKQGADRAMYEADRDACRQHVDNRFMPWYDYGPAWRRSTPADQMMGARMEIERLFRRCMEERGYELMAVERPSQ
jgi:hypothetical protein